MHSLSISSVYPYPSSPAGSASSQFSSWGTVSTPLPGTPYPTPIPLPVCGCPDGHPSPVSCTNSVAAHPALQQLYNALIPPQLAPYSSEPATHPPSTTLTLRLTHPDTQIPSMDITLPSARSNALTVHDVHVFIHNTLLRSITHSDLRPLNTQAAQDAESAFHARTAIDPSAFTRGMCVGDRMGGAWCVVGVVPSDEPGVWEVRLRR